MLREHMRRLDLADQFICPALPASPRMAAQLALYAARSSSANQVVLIGSSLGGYYATWVAEQLGCRAVLLNPAVDPARDLQAHIGRQPVFFSDEEIDFRPEYINELRVLDAPVTNPDRYFLIAASGDTVINYRMMVAKYYGARQMVIEGSDHELSDFALYVDQVLSFCGIEQGV